MMHTLIKASILLLTGTFGANAWAACLPDTNEPGDLGPSSAQICHDLEHAHPNATVAVDNRAILASDTVAIDTRVNHTPVRVVYKLAGWHNWHASWSKTSQGK